jgi:hypothetical protein
MELSSKDFHLQAEQDVWVDEQVPTLDAPKNRRRSSLCEDFRKNLQMIKLVAGRRAKRNF